MPAIYEYRCEQGHVTEYMTVFGTQPPKRCPDCGRVVERVISAANVPPDGTYSHRDP